MGEQFQPVTPSDQTTESGDLQWSNSYSIEQKKPKGKSNC